MLEQMVGTEALPGLTYVKELEGKPPVRLPVYPSDHFGLHVVLEPSTGPAYRLPILLLILAALILIFILSVAHAES